MKKFKDCIIHVVSAHYKNSEKWKASKKKINGLRKYTVYRQTLLIHFYIAFQLISTMFGRGKKV